MNTGGLTMTDEFFNGAITALAALVSIMFLAGVLG